jgi:predicted dithiol-disulfide oxidoreductase (DUF899 family)
MNTTTSEGRKSISDHPVVSREEWVNARKELLKKEKEFTRLRDQLNAESREGDIFHTYSAFARGSEMLGGVYGYLDHLPKGRNETGPNHNLSDWVRHHDRYGDAGLVEPTGRYVPAKG